MNEKEELTEVEMYTYIALSLELGLQLPILVPEITM